MLDFFLQPDVREVLLGILSGLWFNAGFSLYIFLFWRGCFDGRDFFGSSHLSCFFSQRSRELATVESLSLVQFTYGCGIRVIFRYFLGSDVYECKIF